MEGKQCYNWWCCQKGGEEVAFEQNMVILACSLSQVTTIDLKMIYILTI